MLNASPIEVPDISTIGPRSIGNSGGDCEEFIIERDRYRCLTFSTGTYIALLSNNDMK